MSRNPEKPMDVTLGEIVKPMDVTLWPAAIEEEALDFCRSLYVEKPNLEKELAARMIHRPWIMNHAGRYPNNVTPVLALADFKVAFLLYSRAIGAIKPTHNLYWRKYPVIEFGDGHYLFKALLVLLPKRRK